MKRAGSMDINLNNLGKDLRHKNYSVEIIVFLINFKNIEKKKYKNY